MGRHGGWIGAALLALVLGVVAAVGPVAGPVGADPGDGRLRTQGPWIVDEHGRVMLLHGVSNVDKVPPFMELDDGFTLTADDAALLARHGFNTVRLGVEFAGMMPERGQIDEAYLDRIETVVGLLGDAGIYVLLDHHQDSFSSVFLGGNGFPEWAVDPKPIPGEIDLGWPLNSATMVTLMLNWTNFWNNRNGIVDHLGNAFEALTERVAGNPHVLGMEIINEPFPGLAYLTCLPLVGCPVFDAQYQRVHQRLTNRIRAVDPGMPVFWEPNVMWNFGTPTRIGQPPFSPRIGDNIVFSVHDYCSLSEASIYLGLPPTLKAVCDVQHDLTFLNYDNFAQRARVPALVTEFAGSDDPVIASNTLERADDRFLGWQYWHYESDEGERQFEGEMGRQLVRTYPRATAGTPGPMSYDPATGAFRYRYTPSAAIDAPTEIYLSDLQYADGVSVEVTGACAVSAPGDPLLLLSSLEGATGVDVRITAASASGPVPAWPACDGPAGSTPPPPVSVPPPPTPAERAIDNVLGLVEDAVHGVVALLGG